MKDKTLKELWRYCYSHARLINSFLRTAKTEMEGGNTTKALWSAMEAGKLIDRADTGYNPTGSVYAYKLSETIQFDAYTAHGDRYEFRFSFGDNTPWNRKACTNRREWQVQAQAVERIAEMRRAKRDIARLLNGMSDEDFFKAYDAIKRIAKATR